MKIIQCGFTEIVPYSLRDSTWKKGRKLFNAGHVGSVQEEVSDDAAGSKIIGHCLPQTSVRNNNYKISLNIMPGRTVENGHCSCKAGISGQCKHAAALMIFINEYRESSCTNERQSWGIPAIKEGYSKGMKLEEMFDKPAVSTKTMHKSITEVLANVSDLRCSLVRTMEVEKACEFEKDARLVLSDMIDRVCCQELISILQVILQRERKHYLMNAEEQKFFDQEIKVTPEQILSYAGQTVLQQSCSLWYSLRKPRISSSMCHKVVTRRSEFENLARRIVLTTFKGNTATDYGSKLERAAKASYLFQSGLLVVDCGVVIHKSFPWLCCSPDGLILTPDVQLLEIKCPYSRKGQNIVDYVSKKSFVPYIYYENGWKMKKKHQYYSQIQLSMFILNVNCCILYVYSAVDKIQLSVELDTKFLSEAVPKLQEFYFGFLLPEIVKNKI